MSVIQRIALALVIIGAINWGLIGFLNFDLVATLFGGQDAFLSRVIYALVGLSGLVCLGLLFKPTEEVEPVSNPKRFNNVDYNTEFGAEPDFTKSKDPSKNKTTAIKNQGSPKKKK